MSKDKEFKILRDRRNQLKNKAIFLFSFLYLFVAIFWFLLQQYFIANIIFVSSVLIMLVGLISRKSKYLNLQTNLTLAICFLSLGWMLLMTYQDTLMLMLWLFLVPLGSLMFIDQKGIRFWSPVLMLFVISVPFIGPYFPYKSVYPKDTKIYIEFFQIVIILFIEFILLSLYRNLLFTVLGSLQSKSKNLELATQELEKTQEYKDHFFASVSHELRTPINSIKGIANLLEAQSDENKELIGFLNSSTNHLLTLINDLLDFSRMQAGMLTLNSIHFNLRNTINASNNIIKVITQEKKQNFSCHMDSNLPMMVIGDPNRLTQIIVNVLSNSAKYTPEHGQIDINYSDITSDKDRSLNRFTLKIVVIDNGIGMNENTLKNIFKNYYRSEAIISDQNITGTGLGLSITKYIVEAMQGTISIESSENRGTKVEIILSLPVTNNMEEDNHTLDNDFKKLNREIKIMVVDDNILNSKLAKLQLEKHMPDKCLIYNASNGKMAIEMLLNHDIDIILMDMKMPVMNGAEATRTIRALDIPHKQSVPIIALTANVGANEIQACYDCGINIYVSKPFDINNLIQNIYSLL